MSATISDRGEVDERMGKDVVVSTLRKIRRSAQKFKDITLGITKTEHENK